MVEWQGGDRLELIFPEEQAAQMDRFFERLAEEPALRARFSSDPVGVIRDAGVEIPATADIDLANRISLHLMGDDSFVAWSQSFNDQLRERYGETIEMDDEKAAVIAAELDEAIRRHLPPELAKEYEAGGAIESFSFVGVGLAVLITAAAVFNVGAVVNIAVAWNVALSADHVATSDAGADVSGVDLGADVGLDVGLGADGAKAWGGPDG